MPTSVDLSKCVMKAMETSDLEKVLEWRNNPTVRKNMYSSHEISWDEHLRWFKGLVGDAGRQYFIFSEEAEDLGVIAFTEIDPYQKRAFWAFYSGDLKRRGIGKKMERMALNHAFVNLGLRKLNCEVLSSNEAVVEFHKKHGFTVEGVFREHHYDGLGYQDIYRLGMLAKEYSVRYGQ